MAEYCRRIQERIEETREEARAECRNVSRTISETICSWLPWPLDDLCDLVTRVITEVICTTIYVLITIVSWITRVVCETVFVVVWVVQHAIGILEWLGNRIITLPEWLGCLVGFRLGTKKYRICPMVVADEKGEPVVPLATIQSQIDTAVRVYAQCGIELIARPITTITGRSYLANTSGCDAAGYFGGDRVEFDAMSCCTGLLESLSCLRFPSGLLWPRQILKAIWVDTISSGERGCYMLPESFILIASSGAQDTLAHEMGHAGDLLHSTTSNNLMTTPTRTGSNLTSFQCCTVRTSRFVTLL